MSGSQKTQIYIYNVPEYVWWGPDPLGELNCSTDPLAAMRGLVLRREGGVVSSEQGCQLSNADTAVTFGELSSFPPAEVYILI